MKYTKSKSDAQREKNDLANNPIMRWMRHHDAFRFNVGDILIKQNKQYIRQVHGDEVKWTTETTSATCDAPRKYMYVFENELGIGYLKQIKADGSGFTTSLICLANYDPDNTRFVLDPDYADHLILSDSGEFVPNKAYLEQRKFRDEAIKKNKELLIRTGSPVLSKLWFDTLKVGDIFWSGYNYDEMVTSKYEVLEIIEYPGDSRHIPWHIKQNHGLTKDDTWRQAKIKVLSQWRNWGVGGTQVVTAYDYINHKVTMKQPFPLKDNL